MSGRAPARLQTTRFSSDVSLVEVYASVTDSRGKVVTGLTAADFAVQEDGHPQAITVFAASETPLALAVALDRSFSVGARRLAGAVAAVRTFVRQLRSRDQLMLILIGGDTEVAAPLSFDRAEANAVLDRVDVWGTTPLYDATRSAVDAVQAASGRRALVLLSDGDDRYSRLSAAEIVDRVRRQDVIVYPVTLGKARPSVFAELAGATGGRSFEARDDRSLQAALAAITEELRSQYLLGYVPRLEPGSGGWRSIHVSVDRPGVRVRARDGYAVP